MNYWLMFWITCLLLAGCSFAFITIVVSIRGFKDLREMLKHLDAQRDKHLRS